MTDNSFTDNDKQKVIDFLNLVSTKAEFKVDVKELIEVYKKLSYCQQVLLPKIEANILEVKGVVEPEAPSPAEIMKEQSNVVKKRAARRKKNAPAS